MITVVKRSKGFFSKSRKFLKKKVRERGLPGLTRFLREFHNGDKVLIDVEPSIRRGMPHRRYQGKVGVIKGKRGRAYLVNVRVGSKDKLLIVNPVHLKPAGG